MSTGPCSEAARPARVRAPWTARPSSRLSGAIRKIAPKVMQPAVLVGHDGTVQAGDGLEDRGLEIGQVHSPDDVVEGSLGVLGREVLRVLGIVGDDLRTRSDRPVR